MTGKEKLHAQYKRAEELFHDQIFQEEADTRLPTSIVWSDHSSNCVYYAMRWVSRIGDDVYRLCIQRVDSNSENAFGVYRAHHWTQFSEAHLSEAAYLIPVLYDLCKKAAGKCSEVDAKSGVAALELSGVLDALEASVLKKRGDE